MKKGICILLAALLLTGCAPADPTSPDTGTESTATETAIPETTQDLDSPVDVVLPTAFFAGVDMSRFDPVAYAREQGYEAAVLNPDGTVTVTMTAKKYDAMLRQLEAGIRDQISQSLRDKDYITDITCNEDYSVFTVTVDSAGYQAAFDTTAVGLLLSAVLYRMLLPEEKNLTATVVDETGQILDTVTY